MACAGEAPVSTERIPVKRRASAGQASGGSPAKCWPSISQAPAKRPASTGQQVAQPQITQTEPTAWPVGLVAIKALFGLFLCIAHKVEPFNAFLISVLGSH